MKYVIVTGAYGGMGEKTIQFLKEKGYEVFALDQKVKEKEEHVYPIQVDVTKIESVQTALKEIEKKQKKLRQLFILPVFIC